MSNLELKDPAYLFEVSWEVCNKVGGFVLPWQSREECW